MVLNDELPVGFIPNEALKKLTPHASRWIRIRLFSKRNTDRKLRVASMINYSKRLFPNLPQTMVQEKIDDFRAFVGTPDDEVLHDRHRIEDHIRRSIASQPRFHADYSRPFVPSTASCLERSKAQGGLASLMIDFLKPILEEHPILQKIELIETLGEDIS